MIVKSDYQPPKGIDEVIDGTDAEENNDTIEVVIAGDESLAEDLVNEVLSEIDKEQEHYENLAEKLDDSVLGAISDEVMEAFNDDLQSRSEWTKMYREGIKMLGLGIEERTEPWPDACGVSHPLMAEAAVRFQAEAITETFTASGICKTTIIGKASEEKQEAAKRVAADMNWRLTTQMKEYRPEHERMLWNLVLAGSAFKKVYFDPALDRLTSVFVSALDVIVPYGATDLSSVGRIAHRMRKSANEVRKLQVAGFYRDVELPEGRTITADDHEEEDKVSGYSATNDERLELIEMCIELNIEGYEDTDEEGNETGIMVPYVVTVERSSGAVLSIYRNWEYGDEKKQARQHFVHYVYIPGFGFYGIGLVQLVGGFASGATSLLRQLVDAGTLANLPGGFKTKGVRVQSSDDPISPGEFRDVDIGSGTLKDNIMPLPFKEPSGTLYQLFQNIVDEGRRMASVADLNAADMNQNAAVGTTLAILERDMKVMSAIQARLHAALKEELGLMHAIIRDNLPDEYDYEVDDESRMVKKSDYDIASIIPVSDPNASTMSQRVIQWQTASQMARDEPTIFDKVELYRQGLEIIGVKNVEKLVPASEDMKPRDAVTENMALLTGRPVKAFGHQNHDAHIAIHTSMAQDPKIAQLMGQNPNANVIMAALQGHIAEHAAFSYKAQIEAQLGVPLPDADTELPPEVEKRLSEVTAMAAQQVLAANKNEAAQAAAQAAAQDPVVQNQTKQLEIDAAKVQLEQMALQLKAKAQEDGKALDIAKMKIEAAKIAAQMETARDIAGSKIAADLLRDLNSRGGKQ